jgi:hypothetical protein
VAAYFYKEKLGITCYISSKKNAEARQRKKGIKSDRVSIEVK